MSKYKVNGVDVLSTIAPLYYGDNAFGDGKEYKDGGKVLSGQKYWLENGWWATKALNGYSLAGSTIQGVDPYSMPKFVYRTPAFSHPGKYCELPIFRMWPDTNTYRSLYYRTQASLKPHENGVTPWHYHTIYDCVSYTDEDETKRQDLYNKYYYDIFFRDIQDEETGKTERQLIVQAHAWNENFQKDYDDTSGKLNNPEYMIKECVIGLDTIRTAYTSLEGFPELDFDSGFPTKLGLILCGGGGGAGQYVRYDIGWNGRKKDDIDLCPGAGGGGGGVATVVIDFADTQKNFEDEATKNDRFFRIRVGTGGFGPVGDHNVYSHNKSRNGTAGKCGGSTVVSLVTAVKSESSDEYQFKETDLLAVLGGGGGQGGVATPDAHKGISSARCGASDQGGTALKIGSNWQSTQTYPDVCKINGKNCMWLIYNTKPTDHMGSAEPETISETAGTDKIEKTDGWVNPSTKKEIWGDAEAEEIDRYLYIDTKFTHKDTTDTKFAYTRPHTCTWDGTAEVQVNTGVVPNCYVKRRLPNKGEAGDIRQCYIPGGPGLNLAKPSRGIIFNAEEDLKIPLEYYLPWHLLNNTSTETKLFKSGGGVVFNEQFMGAGGACWGAPQTEKSSQDQGMVEAVLCGNPGGFIICF